MVAAVRLNLTKKTNLEKILISWWKVYKNKSKAIYLSDTIYNTMGNIVQAVQSFEILNEKLNEVMEVMLSHWIIL